MSAELPPDAASPSTANRSWWQRNRAWFVPLLVLSPILLCCLPCGGAMFVMTSTVRKHEAYQVAVDTLQGSPAAKELVGEPIRDDWWVPFVAGDLTRGPLMLRFEVSGPNDHATVQAEMVKDGDGPWTVRTLRMQRQGEAPITILDASAPASDAPTVEPRT